MGKRMSENVQFEVFLFTVGTEQTNKGAISGLTAQWRLRLLLPVLSLMHTHSHSPVSSITAVTLNNVSFDSSALTKSEHKKFMKLRLLSPQLVERVNLVSMDEGHTVCPCSHIRNMNHKTPTILSTTHGNAASLRSNTAIQISWRLIFNKPSIYLNESLRGKFVTSQDGCLEKSAKLISKAHFCFCLPGFKKSQIIIYQILYKPATNWTKHQHQNMSTSFKPGTNNP